MYTKQKGREIDWLNAFQGIGDKNLQNKAAKKADVGLDFGR